MSKQLTILMIGLLFLVSCTRPFQSGYTVYMIESDMRWGDNVIYHTSGGEFWGKQGFYNIGDTVKFCK